MSPVDVVLARCLSAPRLAGYLLECQGDRTAALALYQWNTEASAAFWESLAHLEVAFRNTLADRLAHRHGSRRRAGSWLDDPSGELDAEARKEIQRARTRVSKKGKPASDGQTVAELSFGFWRYLLARRYTTTLWPDLASGFPHAPNRALQTLEDPVSRLHVFRNRIAHHERIWTEPLSDRYSNLRDVLGYIDPMMAQWVVQRSRIPAVLAACPIGRPHP